MIRLLELLRQFFPPELSRSYLLAEWPAVLQTIEIAAAGMLLALLAGLIIGSWVGSGAPGGRALYAALLVLRSFPDIVLAILCVILFGVGPAPGMIAIALFYGAAIGKIYSDLLRAAPRGPVQALQATGASRLAVTFFGLLPLRAQDLVSYGAYEFESAVRAAVIVGAVGGGGLGVELLGAINEFDYRRACTLLLLLIFSVALLDRFATEVKRRPAWVFAAAPLMAIALWIEWPSMLALQHATDVYRRMFPPTLPAADLHRVPRLLWQTLEIALGGTVFGALAALPLSLCASRSLSPAWLRMPARRLLECLRSIPEIVWGLILVTASVLGPPAGIAALALHCTGSLGRLFSESFDNVPQGPIQALASTGAPRTALALFGFIPLAAPTLAVHVLFRLEWNVRAAAVVGIIGAGGIGEELYHAMQLFFYSRMLTYILITGALVAMVDLLSSILRRTLGLGEVFA